MAEKPHEAQLKTIHERHGVSELHVAGEGTPCSRCGTPRDKKCQRPVGCGANQRRLRSEHLLDLPRQHQNDASNLKWVAEARTRIRQGKLSLSTATAVLDALLFYVFLELRLSPLPLGLLRRPLRLTQAPREQATCPHMPGSGHLSTPARTHITGHSLTKH